MVRAGLIDYLGCLLFDESTAILAGNEPHALRSIMDASALVTIVLR